MLKLLVASSALQALSCLLSVAGSSGDLADDAVSLVQNSLKLSVPVTSGSIHKDLELESNDAAESPMPWDDVQTIEESTIGSSISPGLLDDDFSTPDDQGAATNLVEKAPQAHPQSAALTEAKVEMLAATVDASLSRVGSKLEPLLNLSAGFQDGFTQATGASRQARLEALEAAVGDPLESIAQGWSTLAVILRSTVQSTQSKLEMAGQRQLAAKMDEILGTAVTEFDAASQTAFNGLSDSATGLSHENSTEGVDKRISTMQEVLTRQCQHANQFGHSFHKTFVDLAETLVVRATESNLQAVALQRVKLALDAVSQSSAAIAWKIYNGFWMLTTGVLVAIADVNKIQDFGAQISEEILPGERMPTSAAPLKPQEAQSVTTSMYLMESRVDGLINSTKEEMRVLLANLSTAVPKPSLIAGESLIRQTIASAIIPKWKDISDLLLNTTQHITQCLEDAGQSYLANRLNDMELRVSSLPSSTALLLEGNATRNLTSDLNMFMQKEDVLAHYFYRTFSDFLNGLYKSPGTGRMVVQREVSLLGGEEAAQRDTPWLNMRTMNVVSMDGASSPGKSEIFRIREVDTSLKENPTTASHVGRLSCAPALMKPNIALVQGNIALVQSNLFGLKPHIALVQSNFFDSSDMSPRVALMQSNFSVHSNFSDLMSSNITIEDADKDNVPQALEELVAAASVQEAAAIAWKVHSAAWVLVGEVHQALAILK